MSQECTESVISLCIISGLVDAPVPSGLTLQTNQTAQTLSLMWESDSSGFDIEIFHTELMNVVMNVRDFNRQLRALLVWMCAVCELIHVFCQI